MLSPRFIPKSVFYTQSPVRSPQSAVRSPQSSVCSFHFNFRNNETEDMLVYQSNLVGVELFSYVNTFVEFVLHILCREI